MRDFVIGVLAVTMFYCTWYILRSNGPLKTDSDGLLFQVFTHVFKHVHVHII